MQTSKRVFFHRAFLDFQAFKVNGSAYVFNVKFSERIQDKDNMD